MEIVPVPVLSDNYAYLLIDTDSKTAAAVDPVEPRKVLEVAKGKGARVSHILTTHAHWDHAGGNVEFAGKVPGIIVVGGVNDGIPACTHPVRQGDVLQLGDIKVEVLDVPCHTPGHVAFLASKGDAPKSVFTGDTLFVGGCGNFNSGTPQQMYHALIEVLGALPDNTGVFVGHNYTEKNLRWALHCEPDNQHVQAKLAQARQLDQQKSFIPSTIGKEKLFNPFMRCVLPSMQEKFGKSGKPVEALLEIRRGKDLWGKSN